MQKCTSMQTATAAMYFIAGPNMAAPYLPTVEPISAKTPMGAYPITMATILLNSLANALNALNSMFLSSFSIIRTAMPAKTENTTTWSSFVLARAEKILEGTMPTSVSSIPGTSAISPWYDSVRTNPAPGLNSRPPPTPTTAANMVVRP